jgi:hypothetical protein
MTLSIFDPEESRADVKAGFHQRMTYYCTFFRDVEVDGLKGRISYC